MTDEHKEAGKIAKSLGGELRKVLLAEIEFPERYRQDYGDLNELALSMQTKGQLQNLVCVKQDNEKPYRLLAGGRRYKTMQEKLGWTECSALIFPNTLDELELIEVEFEENCRRKALTWEEDVAIKKKIYELRIEKFGQKISNEPSASGTSMTETAELFGRSAATFSLDINLAKAVEAYPEIFEGCKNKKEAQKKLQLVNETLIRGELAKRIESRAGIASQFKNLADRYIIRNFFDGVKSIPDKTIDFCEIDPPYAIALQQAKRDFDTNYSSESYNEVDIKDYLPFIDRTITECYRVMAEHSFLVLWHAPEPWGEHIYNLLTKTGLETTRLTGKWVKPTGQSRQPTKWLANCCEEFFYARKGDPSLVRQGRGNVFTYTPVPSSKKTHPTERPLELIQEILSTFCWEGARILIPFLGSGKTLLAAETLKMNAFGFELSESYRDSFLIQASELLK